MTEVMEFGVVLLFLARSWSAGVAARGGLSASVKRRATKPGTKGIAENAVLLWMEYYILFDDVPIKIRQ